MSDDSYSIDKAEPIKRLAAFVADVVIASIPVFVFWLVYPLIGWVLYTLYLLMRDGLEYPFMDRRSVGKYFLNLRPITIDGGYTDLRASFLRNWPIALAGPVYAANAVGAKEAWIGMNGLGLLALVIIVIEALATLTNEPGRRLGDRMAGTLVKNESI